MAAEIVSRPASDAYRAGFDRVFGAHKGTGCDHLEVFWTVDEALWRCKACRAAVTEDEVYFRRKNT